MSVRTEKGFFNIILFFFVVRRFMYDACFWEENLWNDLNHFSLSVAALEWFWEWNNNSWTTNGLRTSFRPFLLFFLLLSFHRFRFLSNSFSLLFNIASPFSFSSPCSVLPLFLLSSFFSFLFLFFATFFSRFLLSSFFLSSFPFPFYFRFFFLFSFIPPLLRSFFFHSFF